jgi:hypothetical protein
MEERTQRAKDAIERLYIYMLMVYDAMKDDYVYYKDIFHIAGTNKPITKKFRTSSDYTYNLFKKVGYIEASPEDKKYGKYVKPQPTIEDATWFHDYMFAEKAKNGVNEDEESTLNAAPEVITTDHILTIDDDVMMKKYSNEDLAILYNKFLMEYKEPSKAKEAAIQKHLVVLSETAETPRSKHNLYVTTYRDENFNRIVGDIRLSSAFPKSSTINIKELYVNLNYFKVEGILYRWVARTPDHEMCVEVHKNHKFNLFLAEYNKTIPETPIVEVEEPVINSDIQNVVINLNDETSDDYFLSVTAEQYRAMDAEKKAEFDLKFNQHNLQRLIEQERFNKQLLRSYIKDESEE